jgi:hypothetical protein
MWNQNDPVALGLGIEPTGFAKLAVDHQDSVEICHYRNRIEG